MSYLITAFTVTTLKKNKSLFFKSLMFHSVYRQIVSDNNILTTVIKVRKIRKNIWLVQFCEFITDFFLLSSPTGWTRGAWWAWFERGNRCSWAKSEYFIYIHQTRPNSSSTDFSWHWKILKQNLIVPVIPAFKLYIILFIYTFCLIQWIIIGF